MVPIVDDTLSETMENFSIVFSNPMGGLLVFEDTATINILDDDNPGVISMSLASVAVSESATTLNITATRSVGAVRCGRCVLLDLGRNRSGRIGL